MPNDVCARRAGDEETFCGSVLISRLIIIMDPSSLLNDVSILPLERRRFSRFDIFLIWGGFANFAYRSVI